MNIFCKTEQKPEIKEIIQTESDKKEISLNFWETSDVFFVDEFDGYYYLDEEIEKAVDSLQEMLTVIKDRLPDVKIDGNVSLGNDNYRIPYYFESQANSRNVTVEETLGDVPFSKCWFSYMVNGNYGLDEVGFKTREEFERFIELTRDFREEHGLSFEEFIRSELLESFFDEESEDFSKEAYDKFPSAIWLDELHDLYIFAWKQYQEENGELSAEG